jgi:MFS family permease
MHSSSKTAPGNLGKAGAWLLVAFTGFAYLLNYADRQVIFSIFPILKSELGFTNTQLGLTSSVFLWVYGLCSPLAGRAADRFDTRALICFSLLSWSVVTFLTGVANSPTAILICRGLMGITEAFFVPAAVSIIASVHDAKNRSLAIGLLFTAQLAGLVVGGWVGGYMAQAYEWRIAFYVLGVFGAVYAIPYYLFLRQIDSGHNPEPPLQKVRRSHWMHLLRTPTYVCLCLTFPTYTALLWLLYTWLPTLLFEKFHLNLGDAGLTATGYLQIATLVGLVVGGFAADRLCRWTQAGRFWLLSFGMMFSAPWAHIIGHSDQLSVVKGAIVAFGFFGGMFIANLMASTLDVVNEVSRGTAVGVINLVGTPVSGLAALLTGYFKERIGVADVISYAAVVATTAGLLLAITVRMYFLNDHERAKAKTRDGVPLKNVDTSTCSESL